MDSSCASVSIDLMSATNNNKEEDDIDDDLRLVISDEKVSNSPCSSANEEHERKMVEAVPQNSTDASASQHSHITHTRTSKKDSSMNEPFSWSDYLKETGAIAAPAECFFQDPVPPKNKFEVGKKVEVPDPRGNEVQCLATVVSVHSVWVCVRLDGEDASNDQWLICDDDIIKPVGDAEKKGIGLQPPYGFMYNLAVFHKFIENQLKAEDDGTLPAAVSECFTPISYRHHPDGNLFKVGMKCEAIDYKNFNGRPCPATVVAVDGDLITIGYDGWNQAYDTRQRYDSRHIFPVGWSAKAGLEMQPPKRVKGKVKQPILHVDVEEVSSKETPKLAKSASRKTESTKRKSALAPSGAPQARKARSSGKRTPTSEVSSIADQNGDDTLKMIPVDEARVAIVSPLAEDPSTKTPQGSKRGHSRGTTSTEANSTPTGDVGPSVKKEATPSETGASGSSGPVSKPRAKKTIGSSDSSVSVAANIKKATKIRAKASVSDAASHTAGTAHGPPTSLAAPDIILTTEGHSKMTVYINRNCRCEPMLDAARVKALPAQIGPGRVHHVLREVIQQIVNSATQTSAVFSRLEPGTPRIISITAEINNKTYVRAIPTMKSLAASWAYLRAFVSKLDVCPNLITQSPAPCSKCSSPGDDVIFNDIVGDTPPLFPGRISESGDSEDSEDRAVHSSDSMLASWSVARVSGEVEATFGSVVAAKFTQNQIDGKALMLLTTELLIRHLEMPFGPALKMMSFVESLKRKYRRGTPGIAT
uniref:SLED domain-containing protein n=1 Tax=Ascaris lumbricoides TaxID=6252 RepID=A0A0M3HVK2_ASCLU